MESYKTKSLSKLMGRKTEEACIDEELNGNGADSIMPCKWNE